MYDLAENLELLTDSNRVGRETFGICSCFELQKVRQAEQNEIQLLCLLIQSVDNSSTR